MFWFINFISTSVFCLFLALFPTPFDWLYFMFQLDCPTLVKGLLILQITFQMTAVSSSSRYNNSMYKSSECHTKQIHIWSTATLYRLTLKTFFLFFLFKNESNWCNIWTVDGTVQQTFHSKQFSFSLSLWVLIIDYWKLLNFNWFLKKFFD